MKIFLLNTEHKKIHHKKPLEVEDFEVSNISWTKDGTDDRTINHTELPNMPP